MPELIRFWLSERNNRVHQYETLNKGIMQVARLPFLFLITECRLVFGHCVKLMRRGGVSDHPPILSPGLMYTAQVAFIGFTKGLMTGIMRVM